MRVLHVHNWYGRQAPSGENTYVAQERRMLHDAGYDVVKYDVYSDRQSTILAKLMTAASVPWNEGARIRLRTAISNCQPDIVHIHNVFPLLSPSVFHATGGENPAVVATIHNYRFFCAGGTAYKAGGPCTLCLETGTVLPAVRHACYRDSRVGSAVAATMVGVHRRLGTWVRGPDAVIALNRYQARLLERVGVDCERIHVVPPAYPGGRAAAVEGHVEGRAYAVVVGRLSDERDIEVAIEGWRHLMAPLALKIVGDGPARARLESMVDRLGLGQAVSFLGMLSFEETQEVMARAAVVVFTTRCIEGFPLVIREALALEVPLVAAASPGVSSILGECDAALLFEPGSYAELARAVDRVMAEGSMRTALRGSALQFYQEALRPEVVLEKLGDVYHAAKRSSQEAGA